MPAFPAWLLVTLATLAVFRLTRLIVADVFPPIRWARERLERGPEWLADLVSCHWCASAYVSAGVVALLWLAPGVAAPVLTWAGVWGAGALLADWQAKRDEPDDDPEPEDESEMATMVSLERQVGPNSHVRG